MILIDPPDAAGHGRWWSHLVSDTSVEELHAFARGAGLPARGFERDHYDVPAEFYDRMVSLGAAPVSSRELVARLSVAGLRRRRRDSLHPRRPGTPLVTPAPLAPGDRVAVVAPAGPTDPDRVLAGIRVLEGWGLEVVPAAGPPTGGHPWLAGSDQDRADALASAWLDARVRAVWCTRGGFGSHRVLDLLPWSELAAAPPRWLVGFSDVTALHQAWAELLGVATVHGPGVAALGEADAEVRAAVHALLSQGRAAELSGRPGVGGVAEGVLVGGNLTVLAATVGTPGARAARGGIAVLEDVSESPYRLDRALTQLVRSGWFDGVRGVACGWFTRCGDPGVVRDLLLERLRPLDVPVVLDLPIGHQAPNLPVPLGRPARLDGDLGRLTAPS